MCLQFLHQLRVNLKRWYVLQRLPTYKKVFLIMIEISQPTLHFRKNTNGVNQTFHIDH